MPGVDVLAEQGDLTRTLRHHAARLGEDVGGRAARFGASCVGHHAERAELVAAFLDREEGRHPLGRRRVGQEVKLLFGGKIGVDHGARRAAGAGHHFGQTMIGLRTQHDIDIGGTSQDLGALGLGDATGHRDHHFVALGLARLLQHAQAAEFGEHFFCRSVADMAGVEDHHVGALGQLGRRIAQGRQDIGHPAAVIDIHLAAPGDDVQVLGFGGHRSGPTLAARRRPGAKSGQIVCIVARVKRKGRLVPPRRAHHGLPGSDSGRLC